jgi:hypothetical protein
VVDPKSKEKRKQKKLMNKKRQTALFSFSSIIKKSAVASGMFWIVYPWSSLVVVIIALVGDLLFSKSFIICSGWNLSSL